MNNNWTESQNKIHEGLSAFGPEIAGFYEAGLTFYYENSPNSSYFLFHAAREIDSGLRDVLGVDYSPEKKEEGKHKKSIIFSLGLKELDGVARDWYEVSKCFHGYAHRHGAWKYPRPISEVKPVWESFESVLLRLVGSYYSIIDRMEHITNIKSAYAGVAETLVNLLSFPIYYNYFFQKEQNVKWFYSLRDRGCFDSEKFPLNKDSEILFPRSFDYLEKISIQLSKYSKADKKKYGKELIDIIGNVVKYSREKQKINNYWIWWSCVKILNNIPSDIIVEFIDPIKSKSNKHNFKNWLSEWTSWSFVQHQTIDDIGRKLLPKFLADVDAVPFAESIIDAITEIKSSDREPLISGRQDAQMVWDSYCLSDVFKKHSGDIAKKCSNNVVYGVANKLKAAFEYKQIDHHINFKVEGKVFQVKVSRVSLEGINEGEIAYQDDKYTCVVRRFSPKQLETVDDKKDFFAFHHNEPELDIKQFAFVAKDKENYILQIKEKLPSDIDWSKAKTYEKKIEALYHGLNEDYSYIWFETVEQEIRGLRGDAPEVLTIILRDILLARRSIRKNETLQVLRKFLSNDYQFPIFKRLVLFCVGKHWDDFNVLFQDFICSHQDVLTSSSWEVEMQDILKNHNEKFNSKIKARLKELINCIPEYYQYGDKKDQARWQYKWLLPLKDLAEFSVAFAEAKKLAEIKIDKPYEPPHSTIVSSVGHKSPLSKQEILSMPIIDLVEFLADFKGVAGRWGGILGGKPDKRGLAEMLQAAAKGNVEKFTDKLDLFNKQGLYPYVNAILRAFWEALRSEKSLPWDKILKFSKEYIGQPWFIDEAFQVQGEDRGQYKGEYIWVIDNVVDLIREGSRDDERAIGEEYFDLIEKLFDDIYVLIKGAGYPDTERDQISYAMNTTLGKIVESYIIFSLHVARVKKQTEPNWGLKYERFFQKGIEAYIWLGRYLPNIRYLDKTSAENCAEKMIEELSKLPAGDNKWQGFMEGYLFGAYVYDDIYPLMKQHYLKAIENKVFDEKVDERLVQHIAIGYLRGFESLAPKNTDGQDSLFYKMLMEADTPDKRERWMHVVDFFWRIPGEVVKEELGNGNDVFVSSKEKILAFWAWTVENQSEVKKQLDNIYTDFLGALSELTVHLDKIDEERARWLMISAPHIEKRHNVTFFIDYLAKYDDDESVKRIGKIFLKVLDGTTPTFRREDIRLIVERLYKLGETDREIKATANNICNTYGERGVHFLKEIHDENQKNK